MPSEAGTPTPVTLLIQPALHLIAIIVVKPCHCSTSHQVEAAVEAAVRLHLSQVSGCIEAAASKDTHASYKYYHF